jgi:hypothetical protein
MMRIRKHDPKKRQIFLALMNLTLNIPEMIVPLNIKAIPVRMGNTGYLCGHAGKGGRISWRKSLRSN